MTSFVKCMPIACGMGPNVLHDMHANTDVLVPFSRRDQRLGPVEV